MANKILKLGWNEVRELVDSRLPKGGKCYGVPRGGAVVAGLTGRAVDDPAAADFIVDDIVDSGRTREAVKRKFPHLPFYALVDKLEKSEDGWVQFPWEQPAEQDVEENVVRLLEFVGEDPRREGLRDTPRRVVKAWQEMTVGYSQDPAALLGTDFDGDGYDEMIVVPHIEFVSMCEHHCLPFIGEAHVGYVPNHRIVGLSKVARLVDAFARRLQVQERLTKQVADAMQDVLEPLGVGVVVRAKHSCMSCRGVMKQRAEMVTCTLYGAFRQPEVRAEFMAHCK